MLAELAQGHRDIADVLLLAAAVLFGVEAVPRRSLVAAGLCLVAIALFVT